MLADVVRSCSFEYRQKAAPCLETPSCSEIPYLTLMFVPWNIHVISHCTPQEPVLAILLARMEEHALDILPCPSANVAVGTQGPTVSIQVCLCIVLDHLKYLAYSLVHT